VRNHVVADRRQPRDRHQPEHHSFLLGGRIPLRHESLVFVHTTAGGCSERHVSSLGSGREAPQRRRDQVVGENPTSTAKSSSCTAGRRRALPSTLPYLLREQRPGVQVIERHLQLVVVEAPGG